jgi:cytochrome c oxidase cbb3-type subunit 3
MKINCAFLRKKSLVAAIGLLTTVAAMAQQNNTAPAPESGTNWLVVLLTTTAIVLAFIIWGMGQALIAVIKQVLLKSKANATVVALIMIGLLSLTGQTAMAEETVTASNSSGLAIDYGGISANNFYAFAAVILIEIVVIFYLAFNIKRTFAELQPTPAPAVSKESSLAKWWSIMDKKIFTRAIPVEREADILLDHNYDGIKELDNSLPPWWKYGFYVTILVGVVYLAYYHMGSGKNPTEEYAVEMDIARIEKERYEANNKDKIDENSVPMADAGGLAEGKDLFVAKCWACHGKLGEGGAGPNLTDQYWIHKGSLNDIYNSIKVGYPDKGMQAWNKDFTPKQISYIASFIKTLKGTNPPNAKAPQGDKYEDTAMPEQPKDSANTQAATGAYQESTAQLKP